MGIMTGRAFFFLEIIMSVKIQTGSRNQGFLRHNVAVGTQARIKGTDARLMSCAVAKIALIVRLDIDAALIFNKSRVKSQGFS